MVIFCMQSQLDRNIIYKFMFLKIIVQQSGCCTKMITIPLHISIEYKIKYNNLQIIYKPLCFKYVHLVGKRKKHQMLSNNEDIKKKS